MAPLHLVDAPIQGWSSLLRSVLDRPESIDIHFQPIVDLSRGVIAGFEALARFPSQPYRSPDQWFGAATRLNVHVALEAAVIERVLRARALLPANCFLSLNVGPHALIDERVQHVLRDAGALGGIVIEVTEQAAVRDYEELRNVIAPLREAGAFLAVDDAGAGYASLSHIANLRPDFIKIDRALVTDLDRDPAKAAVVETLGTFASRIDAWIVAEGIERAGELQRLMQLEVPLGQGYRLGRPAPRMEPLAVEVLELGARVGTRMAGSGIGALSEPVAAVASATRTDVVAQIFARDPEAELVVVVDEHERPIAVHLRPLFERGERPSPAPLCVLAQARPADVAQRAMTREPPQRFDPVAVIDDLGRLAGVVRIERLVETLATSA
ncbi:MAG: putative diguanylate phosphodiesterase [Solirubrobacterales bacterium]|jgi:EAL domain-containing protein (putative c-di-GMP-specific phosphodiesterase class I)|nr:putative diguanylate phosphodiesterase [Solirubrobacterales bacterium]